MGIKFGSVILTILFLFIAKISFEATTDMGRATADRAPASVTSVNASIDQDYAIHMNGPQGLRN
ncbi:MAG: hypothetical protein ACLGG7_00990 [Bacteriovoracia bacterium]